MSLRKIAFQKNKCILISFVSSFFLLTILLIFIWMINNRIKQKEILQTTNNFMRFQSQVEHLIYSNITLLQGYKAYIETNPNLDEEGANTFLRNLLSKNSEYIRNIGVIKDTTIIWNYPRETNQSAIGVDLADIETQRDLLLRAKERLIPVFQGPVSLIQGGTGFILRIPVVKSDTGYWGQISIVLKGEKVIRALDLFAANSGLNIVIFSRDKNLLSPFGKADTLLDQTPLTFHINSDLINWKVFVTPRDGWKSHRLELLAAIFFALLISILVGIIVFAALKTNYQLHHMSIRDSLTTLFNRHFLDEYLKFIWSAAKKNNNNVGFLILDLNNFKTVNDTHGHKVGDMVLVETARILKKTIGKNGAAFRLGGDEFLIVLPKIEDKIELRFIKECLVESFKKNFSIPDYSIKIMPSIGCVLFPDDGDHIDMLLQAADEQMYLDKRLFKERFIRRV